MTGAINKPTRFRQIVPLCATSVVLLALLGDRALLQREPAKADGYHEAIKTAADAMPVVWNSWLGVNIEVPQAAVKMLHPNVIISRRFHNIATNETVSLLLVQVKDARDVLGHYPPVCYTGQGWTIKSATPLQWSRRQQMIDGMQYEFSRNSGEIGREVSSRMIVDNFFIMRGGTTCREMDDVELAAQDRQRKFFGAAQVQFVHQGSTTPQRRREIVEELIGLMEPTFLAVSAGGNT